jgi:hypothetical protein
LTRALLGFELALALDDFESDIVLFVLLEHSTRVSSVECEREREEERKRGREIEKMSCDETRTIKIENES